MIHIIYYFIIQNNIEGLIIFRIFPIVPSNIFDWSVNKNLMLYGNIFIPFCLTSQTILTIIIYQQKMNPYPKNVDYRLLS